MTERHQKDIVLSINTQSDGAPTLLFMGHGELEVEVTIANSGKRRQLWISSVPGIRPGRRLRVQSADGEQWWRIIELGRMRLRDAAAIDPDIDLSAPAAPVHETVPRRTARAPQPEMAGPMPSLS